MLHRNAATDHNLTATLGYTICVPSESQISLFINAEQENRAFTPAERKACAFQYRARQYQTPLHCVLRFTPTGTEHK